MLKRDVVQKAVIKLLFIFIHRNGRKKYKNTKTIKSERKIEANNLTKQIKTCKPLPIQFMIYSNLLHCRQRMTEPPPLVKRAHKIR